MALMETLAKWWPWIFFVVIALLWLWRLVFKGGLGG